ncbi:MAG: cytochrome c peroxidase [Flavobacteriales bacterium]|jgi:cytochrome c peroxidase
MINYIRLGIVIFLVFSSSFAISSNFQETLYIDFPKPTKDEDFIGVSEAEIVLGQALFFDKEMSGNRNISCATCHSPVVGTVDGLSTNIGTGGEGLSVLRNAGDYPPSIFDPQARGARNMTPLFNLGHKEFTHLFWDGRVQLNDEMPQGFDSPAGENLPFGFTNPLAALSIFAQTDTQEMLGQPGTNEMADLAEENGAHIPVWEALLTRLRAIPEYIVMFTEAFPEVASDATNMSIVHVGEALAAYQGTAFRSDNSPFDRYLHGDKNAMSTAEKRGMELFYGRAKCSTCHSGVFQTDHKFYAIGIPQIGPGFGDGIDGVEDFGREDFTGDSVDRYKFRTPSLRNVTLTGPWGHDGFYNSLEEIVRHHLDPVAALENADPSQIVMPSRPDLDAKDLLAFNNEEITQAIADAVEYRPKKLNDRDVSYILDFLDALTDPSAQDLRKAVPKRVPSGLPLAEIK